MYQKLFTYVRCNSLTNSLPMSISPTDQCFLYVATGNNMTLLNQVWFIFDHKLDFIHHRELKVLSLVSLLVVGIITINVASTYILHACSTYG